MSHAQPDLHAPNGDADATTPRCTCARLRGRVRATIRRD
jgi:hypothetical protein